MMKSTPPTPLEVSKAELLLEILVVTLNAPAHFGNVNQMFDCRRIGQCGKPVFGWLGFANGPLDKQPFLISRRSPPIVTVRGPHAQRRKAGTQGGTRAFAPRNRVIAGWFERKRKVFDCDRIVSRYPALQASWSAGLACRGFGR